MTVGELIDAIKRIEELEAEKSQIEYEYDEKRVQIPSQKFAELEKLIGIYRSEVIE